MKKLIFLFSCVCYLVKAQDSTNAVCLPLNIDSLVSVFEDKRLKTEYYLIDCKETKKVYNTILVTYYRGTRKKIFIID